jgi:hypothetical protein
MKSVLMSVFGAVFLVAAAAPFPAHAADAAGLAVEVNRAVLDFPNAVTFELTVGRSATIERIVLEYGVDRLTCGEVTAKAFPDFEPAARVEAAWVWDMRRSGSEPPGAMIWWQWRVIDSEGGETLVERKEILWLDSVHPWEELNGDGITVHWYAGGPEFGEEMAAAASESVRHIDELIALQPDGLIDLYFYGSYEDLWDSILNEPGWTGGVSYGEYNVIILGVEPGDEEWGKAAVAHELMHTLVDRFTFSCLVRIPSWIHEGLATVSEGGPGEEGLAQLQRAIERNTIFPLRSLGGGFPEDDRLARLAYAQSYSVIDFLIRKGDASRMRSLLQSLGEGKTADDALQALYGFNVDGLDAAWRESVGAEGLAPEDSAPAATPTFVPTFVPLSIEPESLSVGGAPTPAALGTSGGGNVPSAAVILLLCICCSGAVVLLAAVLIAAVVLAGRKQ